MRLFFFILVLANVVAFAYTRYTENRPGVDAQIALLQISPDKVKLLKPGAPPVERRDKAATAPSQQPLACLEWGSFGQDDRARAAAALAKLGLGDKLSQRDSGDGFRVYIPPLKTKAEVDKKASELRALGITDFYIVQDEEPLRNAISLGAFKTEEAANNHLAQLRLKGVRSAIIGPRGVTGSVFVIRDPGDAIAAKIAELKAEFPAASLKAAPCAVKNEAKG